MPRAGFFALFPRPLRGVCVDGKRSRRYLLVVPYFFLHMLDRLFCFFKACAALLALFKDYAARREVLGAFGPPAKLAVFRYRLY